MWSLWSQPVNNTERTPVFHHDILIGCELIMSSSHRWPRQMASSNGLCRYGARVDCCWGWTRRSWGHCQRECHHACNCWWGQTGLTRLPGFKLGSKMLLDRWYNVTPPQALKTQWNTHTCTLSQQWHIRLMEHHTWNNLWVKIDGNGCVDWRTA